MPVTFDTSGQSRMADLTGFTRGTADYALAGVHHISTTNSEFVNYGASAMGALDARVDGTVGLGSRTVATFGLVAPPSGSQTIDFDTTPESSALLIATLAGVNQTTPIRTTKIARPAGFANASASVTFGAGESSADDLLVAFVFSFGSITGWSTSLGTDRQTLSVDGDTDNVCALITAPGSAASQTMTLTASSGTGEIVIFAYSVQPATGGSSVAAGSLVNQRTRLTGLTRSRLAGGL